MSTAGYNRTFPATVHMTVLALPWRVQQPITKLANGNCNFKCLLYDQVAFLLPASVRLLGMIATRSRSIPLQQEGSGLLTWRHNIRRPELCVWPNTLLQKLVLNHPEEWIRTFLLTLAASNASGRNIFDVYGMRFGVRCEVSNFERVGEGCVIAHVAVGTRRFKLLTLDTQQHSLRIPLGSQPSHHAWRGVRLFWHPSVLGMNYLIYSQSTVFVFFVF